MLKKAYLVDGSGYIFRAFYAIAPLSTTAGFPTNALFGFTRMLVKLISQFDSEHVAILFDAGRETFRNEMYSEYKANRDVCPPELVEQMPYFRELAEALGLPILEQPGLEADDLIATLTERLRGEGFEVVIVTGDKDLMQLVSDYVKIWDTMRDRWFTPKEVKEKLGVGPELVVDYLALTGDASDNIPGLSGVGPKTATQLIEKYGGVEKIIAAAKEIEGDSTIRNRKKIAEMIESDPAILRLSRQLVEVKRDASFPVPLNGSTVDSVSASSTELDQALSRRAPDRERLAELCSRFEFGSLLKDLKLDGLVAAQPTLENQAYTTVFRENFDQFIAELNQQQEISVDTETTSLDVIEAEIVGIAICFEDKQAYYIPISHTVGEGIERQVGLKEALQALTPILTNPKVRKIGQNLKYDISVFSRQGIEIEGEIFDTMVAAYLINPDRPSFSLGALAQEYLGRRASEYKEVVAKGETFKDVSIDKATAYSAEDAHFAWLLKGLLEFRLKEQELEKVAGEIEMPLVPVLSRIELKGVRLDTALLSRLSDEFAAEINQLSEEIFRQVGSEFNLNSPKQLQTILFEKLQISTKGLKKTKTGISTDSSVLEKLSYTYEIPRLILRYRTFQKLKSTYVDALPALISPISGRLHTSLNQTVTATGRLSSSDPNLQNIPIQSAEGRRIRQAFVAAPGKRLISSDYSQIELRLLAHMSEDQNLISAFKSDLDIHANTAREILGRGADSPVTADERRMGKTINFGIVYGMSGFRLARDLGISVRLGNEYIENYFGRYPGVKRFFAALEKDIDTNGYVRTIFGRKRYVGSIDTSGRDQGFQRRAALNAPLQGSAADIIKLAMIKIDRRIRAERLPLEMILQIHDELLFECTNDFVAQAEQIIREEMSQVAELLVPLKVSVVTGDNWDETHA